MTVKNPGHPTRFLFFALAAAALHAQQPAKIDVLKVQGNVWALFGGGGNVTMQDGPDGVLLVDTGASAASNELMAAIRQISPRAVRYVINTHVHADHTGGNEALVKKGATPDMPAPARVIAHLSVEDRMITPQPGEPAVPQALWPNDTYSTPSKDLFFNGEAVVITHLANAHTDGDSIVFFRKSDVLSVGDLFIPDQYPQIDIAHGGSVNGLIAGLNKILEIAVPAKYQEGGTMIVPGHGRLCDEADVVEYRDMVTIVRDRVQNLIKQGKTLEQVEAAKPSSDYDTGYDAPPPGVTASAFVESIYKSLKP